eukprot:m.240660 g.240660  ORF g.240660 m.240660 type:complete len:72 (-) comp54408_c0_seq8:549-764(-)
MSLIYFQYRVAFETGFKNSGISIGKKIITVCAPSAVLSSGFCLSKHDVSRTGRSKHAETRSADCTAGQTDR